MPASAFASAPPVGTLVDAPALVPGFSLPHPPSSAQSIVARAAGDRMTRPCALGLTAAEAYRRDGSPSNGHRRSIPVHLRVSIRLTARVAGAWSGLFSRSARSLRSRHRPGVRAVPTLRETRRAARPALREPHASTTDRATAWRVARSARALRSVRSTASATTPNPSAGARRAPSSCRSFRQGSGAPLAAERRRSEERGLRHGRQLRLLRHESDRRDGVLHALRVRRR